MKLKKQLLNILLLIIFTILVLYFSLKDDFLEVVSQIFHLNLFWLFIAVLLFVANLLFRAFSLHEVTIKFDQKYPMKKSIHLTFITQFFNAITPFATGGQPFQVYTLKKDGISVTSGTNIIMQNFIAYQIALVSLGILSVLYNLFFHVFKELSILKNLVTLGFIVNTAVIVFLFLIAFGKKFNTFIIEKGIFLLEKLKLVKDKDRTLKKWNTYIANFHNGAKVLVRDKKMFLKTVLENFMALSCLYLVPLALLYGMGHYEISIIDCIAASSYTMLMGAFVPIPGGTGGLEYGYLRFFGTFIKGPILKASMLLWRSLTYYLGLIIGSISLNIKRK